MHEMLNDFMEGIFDDDDVGTGSTNDDVSKFYGYVEDSNL